MGAMASRVLKGFPCFVTTTGGLHAMTALRRNEAGSAVASSAFQGLVVRVSLLYEKNRSHHQTIQAGGS